MNAPAKDIVSADNGNRTSNEDARGIGPEQDNLSQESVPSQTDNISFEIEKIVAVHKDEDGKTLYQVRWVAYTWIPEECLGPFQHLIKEFLETEGKLKQYATEANCSTVIDDSLDKRTSNDSYTRSADGDCNNFNNSDDHDAALENGIENEIHKDDDANLNGNDCLVKNTKSSIETNQQPFPLPTASMVVIDESVDTDMNGSISTGKQSEMQCPKCQQRFYLKSNLEVHVLFCKGPVILPTCTEKVVVGKIEEVDTSLQVASIRPLNVLSEDQTFEYVPLNSSFTDCTTCTQRLPEGVMPGDSLADLALLMAHSRKRNSEDDIDIYECDECDREFLFKYPAPKPSPLTSAAHAKRRKIQNEKPFCCSICNRGFKTEVERIEHEEKHSNTPSRYSCASCGQKFVTRNMLQEHYDREEKCQPTKCDVCGRTFVHNSHLRRHLSIHAGVKPFACSICGHEFNQRSDLQRHEKKHTANGKYLCMKCVVEFPDIEQLREHVLSHVKVKSERQMFSCERCDKVFGRKSHYKRHLSIHDGIKPHSCEKCGKSFNQRSDLKRHQMSHVRRELKLLPTSGAKKDESDLICEVCNKVFTNHSAFLEHDIGHQKIMSTGVYY